MKIDLKEVEQAGLTLEEFMVLAEIDSILHRSTVPYTTDPKLYIKMVEDGFITVSPDGYRISTEGYQVFRRVLGRKTLPLKKLPTNFPEFWAAFPASDAHGPWKKTRTLKDNKKVSETLYKKVINNKEATHEEILRALKLEIEERKSNSKFRNDMTFMKASKTWLNSRQFSIILEEQQNKDEDNHGDWTEEMV